MWVSDIINDATSIFSSLSAPATAHISRWISGIEGFQPDRVFSAVALFMLFFLLRRVLRRLMFRAVGLVFGAKTKSLRDELDKALRGPVELLQVVIGTYLAFEILKVDESSVIATFSKHLVASLMIITAYWALLALVEPLMARMRPHASKLTDSVVDWMRKALKCFVVFFAVAAIMEQWGVRIGPLLTGLGIVGAGAALGAQTLFKSLISGVCILMERRFQYGDWIQVEGVIEGTVESIGFRSTRIRKFDDSTAQVPNSDLADNPVINYTQMRRRRIYWLIGVPYSTTIDQLRDIRDAIEKYIHSDEAFVSSRIASTFVRIDSFGASSINIMVYCFTQTTRWGEWLAVKERLAYKIMEIVLGAGSSFAFPSTSLYVESLPASDRPEVFVPPAPVAAGAPAAEAPSAP
ncbi:mechanosensitive ion channel family protein [Segnochrobactraceae bacterium EtOH-i3]